ncbi:hypothetical protein G6F70_005193 [Rhizopus microsporus]|nr:hypothetical protein G6F71_007840 [Rhizopus microsporus]KAG1199145.1 hypothetical protein G6F70_005193 [Rhizopus microsporus]KAG1210972.1 hypothetical protein G6F69_005012 [Rhizopus microsporus]KAG1232590.1 hypothetical protein G6F67_004909 [Rhizopus microsporus]KAG1259271.1 hypothetical protein G6F68_008233 [Rhizopus microsporus]
MQYDSPALQNEAFAGIQKLKQIKRRFEEVDTEKFPDSISTKSTDEEKYDKTMKFVENYKSSRKRMDWRNCHVQLQEKTDVIKYKNHEVLRVQYSRF